MSNEGSRWHGVSEDHAVTNKDHFHFGSLGKDSVVQGYLNRDENDREEQVHEEQWKKHWPGGKICLFSIQKVVHVLVDTVEGTRYGRRFEVTEGTASDPMEAAGNAEEFRLDSMPSE